MDGVMRPAFSGRKPRRSRSPMPPLLWLLPQMMVLLGVARSQSTTLLRRPYVTESQAALCCTGGSCNEGSRARVQLAGVVSALHESEVRSAQLNLNLTSAVEHCRTAAVAARSSQLVADAARNVCDAHALELRASADAAGRLAGNTIDDFRRAADERAALQRRANGADERLRTYDAGLRAVERTLNETRLALNATSIDVASMQSETTRNVSSLSDFVGSALYSINEKINVSTHRMLELFKIANRQESAITWLNQTQHNFEASWNYQAAALNVQLNTSERQRVTDMDALRLSTLSRMASIEDRLESTGSQLNDSVHRLSLRDDSLNDSLTSLGGALRRDLQRATVLAESTILVNEQQRVADMEAFRQSTHSGFALIEELINGTRNQLNDSVERLSSRHNSLNDSLISLDASVRSDVERVVAMTESTMSRVQAETTRNVSSLSDFMNSAIYSINDKINSSTDRMVELSKIANQQESVITRLNQTQHNFEDSWKYQASAFNVQLNTSERQRVADVDALRMSTFSRMASIEDRLESTGSQLNESVYRLSLRHDSLNDSLTSLGAALRRDLQRATVLAESTILVNERQRVADIDALRQSTLSGFALIKERLNSTRNQLNESVERLSLGHNSLNDSLMSLGASIHRDVERVAVMAESTMQRTKGEMASNLSSLSDALYYAIKCSNERINASEIQISELFAIAAQQDMAIGYLNRTQQKINVTWKHQALALSIELNSTKLVLEQLRDELGRLKKDYEGLIVDAQNMSALLRGCPSGWRRHESWCYFLVDFPSQWSDSRGRCKLLNADLVTFITPDLNAFLSTYLNPSGTNYAWLGGTDVESEGTWKWATGEIFYPRGNQRRSYTNFGYGQPDNNRMVNWRDPQNCLAMVRGGSWNDEQCRSLYHFFCRMYKP